MEPAREDLGQWHLWMGEQAVKKPQGVGEWAVEEEQPFEGQQQEVMSERCGHQLKSLFPEHSGISLLWAPNGTNCVPPHA